MQHITEQYVLNCSAVPLLPLIWYSILSYGRVEHWLQQGVGVEKKMMNANARCFLLRYLDNNKLTTLPDGVFNSLTKLAIL